MSPEKSLIDYEVDGALAALMMIHLGVEPYPISPLLLLACCYPSGGLMGKEAHFYESIVPEKRANQKLSAWLNMQNTDVFEPTSALVSEAALLLTLPVSTFKSMQLYVPFDVFHSL
jgi:hypothetical protein